MFKNKKRIFFTLSLLLFCGLASLLFLDKKSSNHKTIANNNQIKGSRAPASIPDTKKKIKPNTPKVSKELKEKLKSNFEKKFPDKEKLTDWEVTSYRQKVRYKNHPFNRFQHVKINFEYGGKYGAFEALIDPKTGSVLRTWNNTRYEIKKPPRLNITGKEYFRE